MTNLSQTHPGLKKYVNRGTVLVVTVLKHLLFETGSCILDDLTFMPVDSCCQHYCPPGYFFLSSFWVELMCSVSKACLFLDLLSVCCGAHPLVISWGRMREEISLRRLWKSRIVVILWYLMECRAESGGSVALLGVWRHLSPSHSRGSHWEIWSHSHSRHWISYLTMWDLLCSLQSEVIHYYMCTFWIFFCVSVKPST